MRSLRDSLRKTLARRHMGHQMVGAVALNIVRDFLGVQKHTKSVDSITSVDDRGEHDEFMEFAAEHGFFAVFRGFCVFSAGFHCRSFRSGMFQK